MSFAIPTMPLLAVDAGQVIGVVFVTITILSWLAQLLGGGKNANAAPRQRMGNPARPLPEQLQEGIELFKKMVAEQQQLREKESPMIQPNSQRSGGEEATRRPGKLPDGGRSSSESRGNSKKKSKNSQGKKSPSIKDRSALGGEISSRHLPVESDLRERVLSEAKQHLSVNSIGEQVGQDLSNQVSQEVASHLGPRQEIERSEAPNRVLAMRLLLRNRERISQAIVINEILQRPLALRKKRT